MGEFLKTLLIACIPSLITGVVTYLVSYRNAKSQISIIREQNKHDIEKLMEQHKIDIDSLIKKYQLESEEKEKEHSRKVELMRTEYELKLKQQENEAESAAKYGAMKDLFGGLMGGMVSSAINTPEVQEQMSKAFTDAFKKKEGEK